MKKILASFLLGFGIGLACSFLQWPFQPTPVESSLAQLIYENIKPYGTKDYHLDHVLQMVQEIAKGKRKEKSRSEGYEPLVELASRQIEAEASDNLRKAEKTLQTLKERPGIIPIVDHYIYVEVIEEGNGEFINPQDVVKIQFREYNTKGEIVKDTFNAEPIAIPLAQTIKGFQLGLNGMKVGERRKIYIHPEYGFAQISRAEPNQLLIYEVALFGKETVVE